MMVGGGRDKPFKGAQNLDLPILVIRWQITNMVYGKSELFYDFNLTAAIHIHWESNSGYNFAY